MAGTVQPHTLQETVSTDGSGTVAQVAYSYDAAGNTTAVNRDGTTETLAWGPQNHLQSIDQDGEVTGFVYDAEGNWILSEDPGGMTLFLPGLELHQSAGTSTVTATRYIELPGDIAYVCTLV